MEFVIVLAALMLRGVAAATDFPVVTSSSPSGIRINETASLACNYSGMALSFGDTVEWRKDGEMIASQGTVMPSWQITVRVAFSATTSVVDVTGLSLATGGTYTCVVRKNCAGGVSCPSLAASFYLPVYGPPLAVAWQGAIDAPGGSQLELRPIDGPRSLIFDVYGLYNVSSFVSVTLSGRNVTGEFTPAVVASGADLSVYNVSFRSSASLSQSAADGDVLNATIAVPLYPPMSAIVTIFVTATPNVSCPSEIQAWQGDSLRVVCTVYSNPPARTFNWSTSGRTFLSGNDTLYNGRATSLVIEESRNQHLVTLEIYNATNADFAVYSLEVANLMGISKKDVRFLPGVTAETTVKMSSGDSQHRLQWIILFMSVAIQAASQKAL